MPVQSTTWNPSDKGAAVTLSGGNLTASTTSAGAVRSIYGASSGKFYWEIVSDGAATLVGVGNSSASLTQFVGKDADSWSLNLFDGTKYNNNVAQSYTATPAVGATIGVALDMDAGTLRFFVNGVDQGVAFTGLTGTLYAMVSGGSSGTTITATANFGGTAQTYSAPSGFNAGLGNPYGEVTGLGAGTSLGTPFAVFDQFVSATGLSGGESFGTPYAVFDQFEDASGFTNGVFGDAIAVYDRWLDATAIEPTTTVGDPARLDIAVASSIGSTLVIPMAYYPFDQTLEVTGSEFITIPAPLAMVYTAPSDTVVAAAQPVAPAFAAGRATCLSEVTFEASGLQLTAFGTPAADDTGRTLSASALDATIVFGAPEATEVSTASGFRSTAFGSAVAEEVVMPASIEPLTRFGLPSQGIGDAYRAYGVPIRTRVGHPVADQRLTQDAEALVTDTAFGSPTADLSFQARTTALVARFGQSLLLRG